MQVIYVDVYFAINFLMDLIILIIAKQILERGKKISLSAIARCVMAAIFGAFYAVFVLVLNLSYGILQMAMTFLIVPGIMAYIAFKVKKREVINTLVIVYCVTFAFNGVVEMLDSYSFWGRTVKSADNAEPHKRLNVLLVIFAALILTLLMKELIRVVANTLKNHKNLYEIRIVKADNEVQTTALCDTGNSLREPYTKKPVSVLQYDVIEEVLTENEHYTLIPFHSVGKSNGMLVGITADYMEVKNEKESITIANPVLGLYKGKFSGKGHYKMLLNPDLVTQKGGENDTKSKCYSYFKKMDFYRRGE